MFVRSVHVSVAAMVLMSLAIAVPAARAAGPVRAALITAEGSRWAAEVTRGARVGGGEAAHTARLMGRDFALDVREVNSAGEALGAARKLLASGATLIVVDPDGSYAAAMAGLPSLFLQVSAPSVVPKRFANALRISPSPEERERARRLARARGSLRILAWDPSLERYGAGELNERYRQATDSAMDEAAFLGWLAVKVAFESALRGLAPDELRVDGYKGVPLHFNGGALQQPLYAVVERHGRSEVLDAKGYGYSAADARPVVGCPIVPGLRQ